MKQINALALLIIFSSQCAFGMEQRLSLEQFTNQKMAELEQNSNPISKK